MSNELVHKHYIKSYGQKEWPLKTVRLWYDTEFSRTSIGFRFDQFFLSFSIGASFCCVVYTLFWAVIFKLHPVWWGFTSLVPRPHFSPRPRRFGSRGPCENVRAFPARSSRIRQRNELTEREREYAVQGLGKGFPLFEFWQIS